MKTDNLHSEEIGVNVKTGQLYEHEKRYAAVREAGPELLEALEELRQGLLGKPEDLHPDGSIYLISVLSGETMRKVDAAIAKARGEA